MTENLPPTGLNGIDHELAANFAEFSLNPEVQNPASGGGYPTNTATPPGAQPSQPTALTNPASSESQTPASDDVPLESMEGYSLLKPLDELSAYDAMNILEASRGAYLDGVRRDPNGEDGELGAFAMLKALLYLAPRHIVRADKQEEWARFASAKNVSKASNLVGAYIGELGKGMSF